MLSRVANSLYWTGRYIERTDFMGRFLKINYFSSLDAPNALSQSRKFVLETLLLMGGHNFEGPMEEEKILYHLGFDKENPNSLISTISSARQNAHVTRHLLSTETWEAINKTYHFINSYPVFVFVKTGLFDLTSKLNENCSIVREKIIRTLLHDEVWALLMLGISMERAIQMVRMINTKNWDVEKITSWEYEGDRLRHDEWATLLRCAEAYDMSKKHYKRIPDKLKTIEFLVLNAKNPKSVVSNINKVKHYISHISNKSQIQPGSVEFKIGKLVAYFSYLTIEEIAEDVPGFLAVTQDKLNDLGATFASDYLLFQGHDKLQVE